MQFKNLGHITIETVFHLESLNELDQHNDILLYFLNILYFSCVSKTNSSRKSGDVLVDGIILAEYQVAIDLTPENEEPEDKDSILQSVQLANLQLANKGMDFNGTKVNVTALQVLSVQGSYCI